MLRADRLATLYLFHPLTRRRDGGDGRNIPILMYHSVSETVDSDRRPYYQTVTTPGAFAAQMRFLKENGYQPMSLPAVLAGPADGSPVADSRLRPVAITFDDGFEDFYTQAFPILDRYGFTATMFLPTRYTDTPGTRFQGRRCLSWKQVRELGRAGIQFGSHTHTHPCLASLNRLTIGEELRRSKARLEDQLERPADSFAYPYAFPETDATFRNTMRELLAEAGYNHGVSTILGVAHKGSDRYFLPRLPVNTLDDARFFQAKLEGGYDWLHPLQYGRKMLRRRKVGETKIS